MLLRSRHFLQLLGFLAGASSLHGAARSEPPERPCESCGANFLGNERQDVEGAVISDYREQYGLNLRSNEGLWDVRITEDKGLGVFARRDVPVGTHIMVEEPLFAVDPGNFVSGRGYSLKGLSTAVEESFQELNETSKAEYLSCHEHREGDEPGSQELLIFRSNAYSMPNGQIGIFPRIAKINHSCRPNSVNFYSQGIGARIIWAGRDIAGGEEITVTYAPLTETAGKRRARLSQYGFHCECEACRAAEDTDETRSEMGQLVRSLETELSRKTYGGDMVPQAQRLIDLVEEEGLVDYKSKAYRLGAYAASRKGDYSTSRKMAREELKVHETADDSSPEAVSAREFIAALPLL